MHWIFATSLVSEHLVYALSWTLLHSFWQGILLAMAAAILMLCARQQSANLRYNLLTGLLCLFALCVGATFLWEWQLGLKNQQSPIIQYFTASDLAASALQTEQMAQAHNWFQSNVQLLQALFNQNHLLFVSLWLLVLSYKSIKMIWEIGYTYRLRRQRTYLPSLYWRNRLEALAAQLKLKQPVQLLESALITGPAALGFFKPLILIPLGLLNQLPAEQVEAILLHELAHIRRSDYLVNFIQNLLENTFFFNPGLLWVSELIRKERENCCDDLAIAAMKNKTLYISALVAFQEYKLHGAQYALAFAGQKTPLLDRVKRIINHHNYKSLSIMEKISLLSTVLLISALSFLSIQHTQAQATKEKRIASFTNINVGGNGTANSPQIMFLQDADGKTYSVKRVDKKIQEMYVNGEKQTEAQIQEYASLIQEIDEQIEKDRKQAELDRAQAERDRAQAEIDRQQAERDREQADRDRERANLDRQQAERDREQVMRDQERAHRDALQAQRDRDHARSYEASTSRQAELDRAQAERDRLQAERDRKQADLDRQQAERDREQAIKDRAQAELDRAQAEKDRVQAEKDRVQAEKDRKEAQLLLSSIIEELVKDKLVKDKESLQGFRLSEDALVVNGVKQSQELHTKYKQKFIKHPGYGIYYGSDSRAGRGYFFSKE
jgi:beta-lactamase regulating signal transducer with metallopeptidase domain